MHLHPLWILSAEKQKDVALQSESPLSSCPAEADGAFFCCHLSCQLLRKMLTL